MSVVLLSGGIDSLVCAEQTRRLGSLVGCVFVDYGHPAQVPEGWKAFAYCGARGVPLKVVHVFGLDLGDMAAAAGARVVPCRNAMLLSVAANAAKSMGANQLVIGATSEDQMDYPDCRPAFIDGMSRSLGVGVDAPLLGWDKRRVIKAALAMGLSQSDAWSCYGPGPAPCGDCPSCAQAAAAWTAVQGVTP